MDSLLGGLGAEQYVGDADSAIRKYVRVQVGKSAQNKMNKQTNRQTKPTAFVPNDGFSNFIEENEQVWLLDWKKMNRFLLLDWAGKVMAGNVSDISGDLKMS